MATNMNGTNEKAFVVERKGWRKMLPTRRKELSSDLKTNSVSSDEERPIEKWTMGILNDKKTEEVPGTWISFRLLLPASNRPRYHLAALRKTQRASRSASCSRSPIRFFTSLALSSFLAAKLRKIRLLRKVRKEENRGWEDFVRAAARRLIKRSPQLANLATGFGSIVFGILLHARWWTYACAGRRISECC